MATTQSPSSSSSSTDFFHGDDLCNWEFVEHDDDDDSNFGVQSLDSFPSSSSEDETLETGRPGIDYSFPEILYLVDGMIPPLFVEQDSDVDDRGDGNGIGDDDGAFGVGGFYSGSIDLEENPFLELESLCRFIDPEGFRDAGVSSRIEPEVGNRLCDNGSFDDLNCDYGEKGRNLVVDDVCDAGSMAVDLGQNPFLEWDSLYQFIANAILDAAVQHVSSDGETAIGDVNGGVEMSSKSDCEEVNEIYTNGDHRDHDALGGYRGDPELKVDIGQSSDVQEAGVSGSLVYGHPCGHDVIKSQQSSSNGHEELAVKQAVEHDDSDGDVPHDDEEDGDMGEYDDEYDLDDELVPWGSAHQLRSQRMRKLAKKPCARMTKSKRVARMYTVRGCNHGKRSLGLIEAF